MAEITLELPEHLHRFLQHAAEDGGFPDQAAYILSLIRERQHLVEKERLEQELLKGVASLERGERAQMTSEDWDRLHQRLATKSTSSK